MESRFDVFAKTLASAGDLPRWEALRRMAGALAATAVTSWIGIGCGGVSQVTPQPAGGTAPGSGSRAPAGGTAPGSGSRAPASRREHDCDDDGGDGGGGDQGGDNRVGGNTRLAREACPNPSPSPNPTPKCEDARFPAGTVNVGLGALNVCAANREGAQDAAIAGFRPLAGAQADALCAPFDSCNPPKSTCKHVERGLVIHVTCLVTQTNCTPPQQGRTVWTCTGALRGIPAGCTCRR